MESYITFGKRALLFKKAYAMYKNNTEKLKEIHYQMKHLKPDGKVVDNNNGFIDNILEGYFNAKIFRISDDTKRLLALTKTPKENLDVIKLPFEYVFIDVMFDRDEMLKYCGIDIGYNKIFGILMRNGELVNSSTLQKVGTSLRISLSANRTNDEDMVDEDLAWFDTFSINHRLEAEWDSAEVSIKDNAGSNPKAKKFISEFAINFLNFLNDSEVQYITNTRTEAENQKRWKRGKLPIPEVHTVRLTGTLRVALERFSSNKLFEYGFSFWCRGHFMRFRSDRYVNMQGKKIWVLPFVKGQGHLVEKRYLVEV
jgi:hypothetical protein